MSDFCEVCESVARATSSCPATDVIMVRGEVANATSAMVPALQPQGVVTGSASANSAAYFDVYAVLVNPAHATSSISPTLVVTDLLRSKANGVSSVGQAIEQMAVASANAVDELLTSDASSLLVSAAKAVSSVLSAGADSNITLISGGVAKSYASLGLLESVESDAHATGVIAVIQRRVGELSTSSADAESSVIQSGAPETFLLVSTAEGTSLIQARTDVVVSITSTAEGVSDVWFRDPTSKAWVMNTETAAVNWYDNYSFESIVSWRGRELAVGPEGIYELSGGTDSGQKIEAFVASGFTDFGTAQTKRLDNMYFGYTSDGQIAVKAEVYESGSTPATYLLEERDANAPRNSRVTPGKGLWGRYWRLTITNVDGSDFEVHDATVDIAVSARRI